MSRSTVPEAMRTRACTCCGRFPLTAQYCVTRPKYRPALLAFFVVCVVAGVPLSWPKTTGGDVVTSVGFELPPLLVPARDLSASCSMAHQVDTNYSRTRDSPHGQV